MGLVNIDLYGMGFRESKLGFKYQRPSSLPTNPAESSQCRVNLTILTLVFICESFASHAISLHWYSSTSKRSLVILAIIPRRFPVLS